MVFEEFEKEFVKKYNESRSISFAVANCGLGGLELISFDTVPIESLVQETSHEKFHDVPPKAIRGHPSKGISGMECVYTDRETGNKVERTYNFYLMLGSLVTQVVISGRKEDRDGKLYKCRIREKKMGIEEDIERIATSKGFLMNLASGKLKEGISSVDAIELCCQIEGILYSLEGSNRRECARNLIDRGYKDFIPLEVLQNHELLDYEPKAEAA